MARKFHDTERIPQAGDGRLYEVTCIVCGKHFMAKRFDASFDSSTCRNRYSREAKQRKADRDNAIDLVQLLVERAQRDNTGADIATLAKIERIAREALLGLSQQRTLVYDWTREKNA